MNNEYTNKNKELLKIRGFIKEHEVNETDLPIQKLKLEVQLSIKRNAELNQSIYKKDKILKDTFEFFFKYDKKSSDIVQSINIYSLNLTHSPLRKREEFRFKNREVETDKLRYNNSWGITECNTVFKSSQCFPQLLAKIA